MRIATVGVFVNDPMAAHVFYTETLGFRSHTYMPEANVAIVVSPEQPDGTTILLEPNDNPIANTYQKALYAAGFQVIVFGVANLQAEYERLLAAGVKFKKPPTMTPWGMEAIFDDTCGNYIQLSQIEAK